MKIKTGISLIILLVSSLTTYSQEQTSRSFKADINKVDIKTVLKAVADRQIETPLTHDPAKGDLKFVNTFNSIC